MPQKEFEEMKIVDIRTISRAFLGSALGSTSFMIAFFSHNEMTALGMGMALAFAFLIIIDAVFPFYRRFYGISFVVFVVLGIASSVIMSPRLDVYFVVLVLFTIFTYRKHIPVLRGKHVGRKKDD
ncbi:MAG: hypothetical protein GXO64_03345 [Candidatus Micrarchaeota archaeon]|nr:hypothetical protein [Candidatus Micrarchaeota archaeon]